MNEHTFWLNINASVFLLHITICTLSTIFLNIVQILLWDSN
jgi:hypothetical protein